jgi:hypothetical protein
MKKFYTLFLLLLLPPMFTYAIDTAATIKKVPATGTELFVGIGMVSSTVSFSGEDELNGARSSGNLSPQINAGADFYFDKYSKALIFRVALSYNFGSKATLATTYSGDATNETNLIQSTEVLKFTQATASITPQLIWNFYNSKKLKIYIDAGLGVYADMFSDKNYTVTTHYTTSGTTTTSPRAFPSMHSVVYIVPVQAGIMLSNNINIYAGYIPKTSLNSDIGYSIDNTRYQAGINYMFNIK